MSELTPETLLNNLIRTFPEHEAIIRRRDKIVKRWCQEHNADPDKLTIEHIVQIRELPEWKATL